MLCSAFLIYVLWVAGRSDLMTKMDRERTLTCRRQERQREKEIVVVCGLDKWYSTALCW